MKKILLPLLLLVWSIPASAQNYTANVQLTIDNTAAGISFTSSDILAGSGHLQANSASCTSNSSGGDFRYRVDGVAPTTSVGVLVPAGGNIVFTNTITLLTFKAIRTASTSAVLSCTLSSLLEPPVAPVGGGGSGGSSGPTADVNLTEVGGAAIALGQTTMAASLPVAIASDQGALTVAGGLAANGAAAATNRVGTLPAIVETATLPTLTDGRNSALYVNESGALVVAPSLTGAFATDCTFNGAICATGPPVGVRVDTTTPSAEADGDMVAPWALPTGALVTANIDPCSRGTKVYVPISQATSTVLVTGTASNRTFICSVAIMQMSSATQTWSLAGGTTATTCGTSAVGLIGGATAANGTDLSVTQGNGASTILKTDTDADDVCLLQSSTTRLNGWLTYVVAPNQ